MQGDWETSVANVRRAEEEGQVSRFYLFFVFNISFLGFLHLLFLILILVGSGQFSSFFLAGMRKRSFEGWPGGSRFRLKSTKLGCHQHHHCCHQQHANNNIIININSIVINSITSSFIIINKFECWRYAQQVVRANQRREVRFFLLLVFSSSHFSLKWNWINWSEI